MRKVLFCLIYIVMSVGSTHATLFVDESALPAYMLNQKDPLFYSEGIIDPSGISSLCGPTSVMNWLQLRNQNAYSKIQLVNFVQVIGQDLRQQNIEINNGLTEFQLLEFLKIYNSYLEENSEYVLRRRADLQISDLLSDTPQILMLRYAEPVRFSAGGPRRDEFKTPVSGNHYVLKVGANIESSELLVIDPENPEFLTRLKIEPAKENGVPVLRLRPQSKRDLGSFRFGVPLLWTVNTLIEQKRY